MKYIKKLNLIILGSYVLILNVTGLVVSRIKPQIKTIIMNISVLLLLSMGIVRYLSQDIREAIGYDIYDDVGISIALWVVILISGIDKKIKLKSIEPNSFFMLGWFCCFVSIAIAAKLNSVYLEYGLWPSISLLIAIPFAMVWLQPGKRERLFQSVAQGAVIVGELFFLMNLIIGPFIETVESPHYVGIVVNPNHNGMISIGVFSAALFLLLTRDKHSLINAIILGLCIAVSAASHCRTTMLAMVAAAIVGISYFLLNKKKDRKKNCVRLIILFILIAAIATISYGAFISVKKMNYSAYAMNADKDKEVVSLVQENETLSSIDKVLSKRLRIWEAFLRNTNWLTGKGSPTEPLIPKFKASQYAHNNALEILYTSGFFAFAGYLMWIASGFAFLIKIFRGTIPYRKELILTGIVFVAYVVETTFEVMIYPTSNLLVMLMYICMSPIAFKEPKTRIVEKG